jgi:hypothetical protein
MFKFFSTLIELVVIFGLELVATAMLASAFISVLYDVA